MTIHGRLHPPHPAGEPSRRGRRGAARRGATQGGLKVLFGSRGRVGQDGSNLLILVFVSESRKDEMNPQRNIPPIFGTV